MRVNSMPFSCKRKRPNDGDVRSNSGARALQNADNKKKLATRTISASRYGRPPRRLGETKTSSVVFGHSTTDTPIPDPRKSCP